MMHLVLQVSTDTLGLEKMQEENQLLIQENDPDKIAGENSKFDKFKTPKNMMK